MTGRLAIGIALVVALGLGGRARAQDEEGGSAESVTATAVMLLEGGATAGQGATVSIGLRRGLTEVGGVRFVHPVDVLSPTPFDEDVQFAIEELEPLADQVANGDARDAAERADRIVELFEQRLEAVRREQLVDAHMLAAVARCQMRRARECEEGFARVLVFREGQEFDASRYPASAQDAFERARTRTLAGPRGTLIVETEPAGAEIYVDGRSYGPSPVRVDGLLRGDHYVTIKHLGYERVIRRATLDGNDSRVRYELATNERAQLVASQEFQRVLRGELGEERAGANLRSLGNTLGAAQVIVGVVRPIGDHEMHVQVWLYDIRTRFLLATREGTITHDEAGMVTARQMAIDLYRGVDLGGAIAAPEDDGPGGHERQPELWEQWWFWTAVGVVLVAGGVGIGAGVATSSPGIPDGWTRASGTLP
ncbi:PEGA domain-containing protein [Sandaracinus amylolyticus]|uniref:TolA protein n=1 Tax=Sandaracinus amylolyticus TaxID=927083 RepID=A0A0F6W968_9BACT|nr:PEGA domain-containing protein [Sandaracinus amylolyticus]AKF10668.1 TolA protein [Sandaracinus amylolyticus]